MMKWTACMALLALVAVASAATINVPVTAGSASEFNIVVPGPRINIQVVGPAGVSMQALRQSEYDAATASGNLTDAWNHYNRTAAAIDGSPTLLELSGFDCAALPNDDVIAPLTKDDLETLRGELALKDSQLPTDNYVVRIADATAPSVTLEVNYESAELNIGQANWTTTLGAGQTRFYLLPFHDAEDERKFEFTVDPTEATDYIAGIWANKDACLSEYCYNEEWSQPGDWVEGFCGYLARSERDEDDLPEGDEDEDYNEEKIISRFTPNGLYVFAVKGNPDRNVEVVVDISGMGLASPLIAAILLLAALAMLM